MLRSGMASGGSGLGPVSCCYEHGNEPSSFL